MRNAALAWRKYPAVTRITLKNSFAYVADFFVRTVFLIVILYIFMQLWSATYAGEGEPSIAGYTFSDMVWYLIVSEAITLALPSLSAIVEQDVKSGDVAYRLTKPMHYVGYYFAWYNADVGLRLGINLLVGGALGLLVFGVPDFGYGWLAFAVVAVGAIAVSFLLNMIVALCAFWVEETTGLEFVYKKLLFTVGGMLMPLEMFPLWLQDVCKWLPFQAVLYFPASTVTSFEPSKLFGMLAVQWGWVAALAGIVFWMYGRGVRKLNVNGG
ncbi:ABC transporter permease [Paenibacillus antri]|uniref:ABC transporter permease n=1 Tax=Paenibacillus antri TaxID=2582848 RepID=A0A5R9G9D8_9BACL|nr:ABC-2 family transporter protein [Paenibacillus antri]TLS50976.1 ABC transporter permease [Paenibacillus antri]